jgi:multidrug efflux system membrane fusion protein
VQRGPNGTYVYVVKDDSTVTVRPITVTQQDDQQAVIATGLRTGEHVVTTGFGRLAEGTLVTMTGAEEAGQIGQKGKGKAKGRRVQTSGEPPSNPP